jgi:hypothetical protein
MAISKYSPHGADVNPPDRGLYELLGGGELESFTLGKSRKTTVASIRAYIDRRLGARP